MVIIYLWLLCMLLKFREFCISHVKGGGFNEKKKLKFDSKPSIFHLVLLKRLFLWACFPFLIIVSNNHFASLIFNNFNIKSNVIKKLILCKIYFPINFQKKMMIQGIKTMNFSFYSNWYQRIIVLNIWCISLCKVDKQILEKITIKL